MKILVGLSGGVDSAAAALSLMKEGHEVEGAVLVMHDFCDVDGAKKVADALAIPLHVIDLREPFDREVKSYFADEYAHGRTPNPCIICNEKIKFAELLRFALSNGFDKIATGHYARVESIDGRHTLARAGDEKKDQTYMLYRLSDEVLSHLILPLSDMKKSEAREMLREAGCDFADKADSQEICFLPDGNYADFVRHVHGEFPKGSFISESGELLGEHRGIINYTVGQRKGLGIALGERMFVTAIDPIENTVTLAPKMSGKHELVIDRAVFSGALPADLNNLPVLVKVRYTAPLAEVTATLLSDGKILLQATDALKAAPGQSAVAYDSQGRVLFGGIIV